MKNDEKHGSFYESQRQRATYKGNKPYIECTYCHKPGYKVYNCWLKYPENKCATGFMHKNEDENVETLLIAFDGNFKKYLVFG